MRVRKDVGIHENEVVRLTNWGLDCGLCQYARSRPIRSLLDLLLVGLCGLYIAMPPWERPGVRS